MQPELPPLTGSQLLSRGMTMLALSAGCSGLAHLYGLAPEPHQVLVVGIFAAIISAIVLFWAFRLAIAFIGVAILLLTRVMTLEQMLASAELDVILFLVGMMTVVAVLKDLGLFSWLIQTVINMRRINGPLFVLIIVIMSAALAGLVDEVTSIVFVLALVFQVCDTLKLRPTPFVLIAVMATNIGSSGTMLGNPVGILIGTRAGFTFTDFLIWAAPITLLCLALSLGIVMVFFRADIRLLTERLDARRQAHLGLGPLIRIPHRRALTILIATVVLIAMHHQIELALGVARNTILIVTPLMVSGTLLIYRRRRARQYIESDVDWWELLFYMMLFTVAGAIDQTGITESIAHRFQTFAGHHPQLMIPLILGISAVGSALVDNIVFVAAFIPVLRELNSTPLWWSLLFGACLGGNITIIGSTANIVAVGMLEKRYRMPVAFLEWLRIGIIVGVLTSLLAWACIALLADMMPPVGIPEQVLIEDTAK